MKFKVKALNTLLLVSFILGLASTTFSQTYGSQILMARKADLIVVAEVVLFAEPISSFAVSGSHIQYNTVVFRVNDVLKGNYSNKLIKVNFGFGFDNNDTFSKQDFKKDNKFILLLEQTNPKRECIEPVTSSEFEQYKKMPCYYSWTEAKIRATDEELENIKWFINLNKKN